MAMAIGAPPTTEIGSVNPTGLTFGAIPWAQFLGDDLERVPELQWPQSVRSYHGMRSDSQLRGLYLGSTLPVRRWKWFLDPNGAKPEIVEGLSREFKIDIKDQEPEPRGRGRDRFSFDDHLRHALLATIYGHMFFEQVGRIEDDGLWHLRKLAPRMPQTIAEINVAEDGGLKSIKQLVGPQAPEIPVNRMVAYPWEKEGGNWLGRSSFRDCYRPWLIKDRLVRVDAMKHEKHGVGTPVAEAPPGASKPEMEALNDMMSKWKSGKDQGGSVPAGTKVRLVGTEGTLPDTVTSLKLCNEEMARAFLMMFMQLGQTETGSRALGASFIDYFLLALETTGIWFRDIFSMHVIEDWVDWNYGVDEEFVPLLDFERPEDGTKDVQPLQQAANQGTVNLPPETQDALNQTSPTPSAAARRQRRATRAAVKSEGAPSPLLPERALRREPFDHELAAQTDFGALDKQFSGALDKLIKAWKPITKAQVEELHAQIISASGNLTTLSAISASPQGADAISEQLHKVADKAATEAVAEAKRQGRTIAKPDLELVKSGLTTRAEAVDAVLARDLSEVAARRAINRTGGSLSAEQVADEVQDHIMSLSGVGLKEQLAGAINQGINAGRRAVMREGQPQNIYSSELLDENTCENCADVDGTEYGSLEEAESDYPTGGYIDCLGDQRCRGTLVAVYDEAGTE